MQTETYELDEPETPKHPPDTKICPVDKESIWDDILKSRQSVNEAFDVVDVVDVARTESSIEATSNPEPVLEQTQDSNVQNKNALTDVISDLATLSPMDYARQRKEMAKELGVPLKTLDVEVKNARVEPSSEMFQKVEPCAEPVVPVELFDEVAATITSFVVLNWEQALALTLWIVMTWVIDIVKVAPLAIINAPEKACGKSQLLEIIGLLSAKNLFTANITTAALFRLTEKHAPTLLIDEVDTFMRENIDIKGLINAGHTRTSAVVFRTVGEEYDPKPFNVFGAKAVAGISLEKHLPDSTMSRGIVFNMRRKLPHELVKRLRHVEEGLFEKLKSKLARFALDFSAHIQASRPDLPDELSDRAQDNWEILLAIAGCAGSEFLKRAVEAALKLSVSEESVSMGTELLQDIQLAFESKCCEKISTSDLIDALCEDDERPWSTYSHGKQITPRQLATLLAAYGIRSKTVRQKYGTPKGFDLGQFSDVFARYLPA